MTDDNRSNERYDLKSIETLVDDKPCQLVNVSSTGVLVAGLANAPKTGSAVELILWVPVLGQRSPLKIEGVVVRHIDLGVGINYATPGRTWPKLLKILDQRLTGA